MTVLLNVQEVESILKSYSEKFYLQEKQITYIPLEKAQGKILAENIYSRRDHPPFCRVAMDGIAVRESGTLKKGIRWIRKLPIITPGMPSPSFSSSSRSFPHSSCFEVATGAVLPSEAYRVIRYEDLSREEDCFVLQENLEDKRLDNVHLQGSDYKKEEIIIKSGTKINSVITALLATEGYKSVPVLAFPFLEKICLVSTGNELVGLDHIPKEYQIRWSNGPALQAEFLAQGISLKEIVKLEDQESLFKSYFEKKWNETDIFIITGALSKGPYDFVPRVLEELGVKKIIHGVAQRPGKPFYFGVFENQGENKEKRPKFFFGLPGNPVSCLINARKFCVPFLQNTWTSSFAKLAEDFSFQKKMEYYACAEIQEEKGERWATFCRSKGLGNGSGDIFFLKNSMGFLQLYGQQSVFKKGESFPFYFWGSLSLNR